MNPSNILLWDYEFVPSYILEPDPDTTEYQLTFYLNNHNHRREAGQYIAPGRTIITSHGPSTLLDPTLDGIALEPLAPGASLELNLPYDRLGEFRVSQPAESFDANVTFLRTFRYIEGIAPTIRIRKNQLTVTYDQKPLTGLFTARAKIYNDGIEIAASNPITLTIGI